MNHHCIKLMMMMMMMMLMMKMLFGLIVQAVSALLTSDSGAAPQVFS